MLPAAEATVVHPHQAAMAERVAVVLAERTLGGSAYMGKDKARSCLRGDPLEVGAVPGRYRRSEEARGLAELGIGVPANAKAIGIVLSASGILLR